MSITKALTFSVLIIAAAVILAQPQPYSGISYGWHIPWVGFYHLQLFAAAMTLFSAFVFSVSVVRLRVLDEYRSHMPMVAYTALAALAAGSSDFPAISLANLFLCVTFSYTSGHSGPDPMGGGIFKLMLLLFLISVPYPMMLLLALPMALMVGIAHASTWKDILSLVLSFVVLAAFSVWAIWISGADPYEEIMAAFSFPSVERHEFVSYSDFILTDSAVAVLFLAAAFTWAGMRSVTAMMDVQSYKVVMFGVWGVMLLSAVIFFIAVGHCALAFYALPFPLILVTHLSSVKSAKARRFLVFLFFGVAVTVFVLSNGLHTAVTDLFYSVVSQ